MIHEKKAEPAMKTCVYCPAEPSVTRNKTICSIDSREPRLYICQCRASPKFLLDSFASHGGGVSLGLIGIWTRQHWLMFSRTFEGSRNSPQWRGISVNVIRYFPFFCHSWMLSLKVCDIGPVRNLRVCSVPPGRSSLTLIRLSVAGEPSPVAHPPHTSNFRV